MQFVGNKDDIYDSTLPATAQYPELTVAEFQSLFHFLSNETEAGILHQTTIARVTVNRELLDVFAATVTLDEFSLEQFGDTSC